MPSSARFLTSTPRVEPALPAYGQPDATVVVDPDATTADVEVALPQTLPLDGSIASVRHDTLISLAFDMISTRLHDDISRGTASFTDSSVSNEGSVRRLDAPSVMVSGEPDALGDTLQAVTAEFERARRFGFDDGEFKRVMRDYRSSLQAKLDGSDTVQDAEYISGFVDHFLAAAPVPDIDTYFQITTSIYDDITADAVGAEFNEMLVNSFLWGGLVTLLLGVVPTAALDWAAAARFLGDHPSTPVLTVHDALLVPPDFAEKR